MWLKMELIKQNAYALWKSMETFEFSAARRSTPFADSVSTHEINDVDKEQHTWNIFFVFLGASTKIHLPEMESQTEKVVGVRDY